MINLHLLSACCQEWLVFFFDDFKKCPNTRNKQISMLTGHMTPSSPLECEYKNELPLSPPKKSLL